jgi:hypothetical protein
MLSQRIDPSKVIKPIQLLAAWLVGLIVIDGAFLAASTKISKPEWAAGLLVIAAVGNVPIFLTCLFLLQTKFRPQLQDDEHYARYLERYSVETAKAELVEVARAPVQHGVIGERIKEVIESISEAGPASATVAFGRDHPVIRINDLLPSFDELRSTLEKAGIAITNTFGTNSEDGGIPSPFLVSAGNEVNVAIFQTVVRIAMRFGLEGVQYVPMPHNKNNIYVGSYGYRARPYVLMTPELAERLLSPDLKWNQLRGLLTGPASVLVRPKSSTAGQ